MGGAAGDDGTDVIAGEQRLRHARRAWCAGAVEAARRVADAGVGRSAWRGRVAVGAVLGTGLGGLVERLDDAWAMTARDTGWLVSSTATGHAGRIVVGRIGRPEDGCWIAALQGRVHGYEGHAPDMLTRGVRLLAALGATTLLATNAAGGLRPDMRVGELVIVSDHVDLVRSDWGSGLEAGRPSGRSTDAAPAGRFAASTAVYDPALVELSLSAARRAGAVARKGVYALCLGPSYETRAEYRMLRRFGADVVGMSTVPEMVAARRLGLRAAAVSVVTNVACPDAAGRTDAEDVCQAAAGAVDGVWEVLRAVAASGGDRDREEGFPAGGGG